MEMKKTKMMDIPVRKSKEVYKKILPEYYEAVLEGKKRFELRKDEDEILPNDILVLNEWDGVRITGRQIQKEVRYVLRNVPEYGLMPGYCIIGF